MVLKTLVDRPRPTAGAIEDLVATASFPSGHMVRATVGLGLLVLLVGRWRPAWRTPAMLAAALCLVVLGAARVASGEHWPSDVAGGLLLGAAWLGLVDWWDRRARALLAERGWRGAGVL